MDDDDALLPPQQRTMQAERRKKKNPAAAKPAALSSTPPASSAKNPKSAAKKNQGGGVVNARPHAKLPKPPAEEPRFAWSAFQSAPDASQVSRPSPGMSDRARAVPEWIPRTLPKQRILPKSAVVGHGGQGGQPQQQGELLSVEAALANQLMLLLGVDTMKGS
jgi:hypothetical protein